MRFSINHNIGDASVCMNEYEVERDYRPVAVAKYSDVLDDDFIPF